MVTHVPKDLTGQKFNRLTVIEFFEKNRAGRVWKCRCDCGNECTVLEYRLTSGATKSCGCLKREVLAETRKRKKADWVERQLATRLQRQNGNNISGFKGIRFHETGNYFEVQIKINYKTRYVGCYSSIEDAKTARKAVEEIRVTEGAEAAVAYIQKLRQEKSQARIAASADQTSPSE